MPPSQSASQITPYTTNVLRDVAGERQRQDETWGPVSRPPLEWLAILAEEFGEVAERVVKGWVPPESDFDCEGYRTELIQVAAVCVSAVECLDYGTAGLGRDPAGRADSSFTTSVVLHVARCTRCRGTVDDDGGEYQPTPEQAVALALGEYGEFERRGDELVCSACCLAEDEPDV